MPQPRSPSSAYTSGQGEHMVAIENSAKVHNLVVCTLCSCYPWPILGLPPIWYKSAPYRSRAVIDPRGVLREFGTQLDEDVEVRVWDSTAELRYLVMPERPAGTENMNEDELAGLVTRDAIIGVAKVTAGSGRMNGVHDMGGMHGMGPIQYEKDEPVFHEPWEGRVYAMSRAMGAWRRWTLDSSPAWDRAAAAGGVPALSYYERWFTRARSTALELWVRHCGRSRERPCRPQA